MPATYALLSLGIRDKNAASSWASSQADVVHFLKGCQHSAEPRLIDPPAQKTVHKALQECWNLMMYANEKGEDRALRKKVG
jgi:hypothetical protein